MRTCSLCGETKAETEFTKKGWTRGRQRYEGKCKSCHKLGSNRAHRTPEHILKDRKQNTELEFLRRELKELAQELERERERSSILSDLRSAPPPTVNRREISSGLREATAVVLASDWHVEEPVDPEKVDGLNEYSLEIADRRIARLNDSISWLLDMHRTRFEVRDLILWLGGDLMTGHIHEELIESSAMSPVETLLWLQQRLSEMIDQLLLDPMLERLIIPCSYGNHGRSTHKPRVATGAEHSYEWLLYQWLADKYSEHDRVDVTAPRSQMVYVDVYDQTIRFTHGDSVRYAGGIGGITIPLFKKIDGWNQGRRADITCVGHFHQYMSLPRVVVNGSLIGYGPYSVRIGARFEPPRQSFFLVDSRHGKTACSPIWPV